MELDDEKAVKVQTLFCLAIDVFLDPNELGLGPVNMKDASSVHQVCRVCRLATVSARPFSVRRCCHDSRIAEVGEVRARQALRSEGQLHRFVWLHSCRLLASAAQPRHHPCFKP